VDVFVLIDQIITWKETILPTAKIISLHARNSVYSSANVALGWLYSGRQPSPLSPQGSI
jgi:hypothetical protein